MKKFLSEEKKKKKVGERKPHAGGEKKETLTDTKKGP